MRITSSKLRCGAIICCGSCFILLCRSALFDAKVWTSWSILKERFSEGNLKQTQISHAELREILMLKRVRHLQSSCKRADIGAYRFNFKQVSEIFYVDTKSNLSYCKVPKAGSSFMTDIFLVLNNDRHNITKYADKNSELVDQMFELSRSQVHTIGNKKLHTTSLITDEQQSKTMTLIISRDPYSRLFSAYVDKFYLLGHVKSAREISQRRLSCGYNVTFQEFLDYVISKAYGGYQIDRHWAPVYLLCHACDVRYDVVATTQTLSADVEHILDYINVTDSTKNNLIKLTHNKYDNKTVISLIDTYIKLWEKNKKVCPEFREYLPKIWKSLQIQGKLKSEISFPTLEFSRLIKKEANISHFTNVFLHYVSKYKVSSEERTFQRRKALVDAFRTVKKTTIRKIQELYKLDFLLFEYDTSPPNTI
ncbi:carbohydrate sulfotransferase 9-like [Ostrea edulis]|uniref:carbohydrate sulfotransferase 9-like n=1 Tax=Ostrea edulis TaxID=37623 RepID=UPI0024AF3D3B|nr:carbohydrate sulfotransferase 9-like [Ostrea edulis]